MKKFKQLLLKSLLWLPVVLIWWVFIKPISVPGLIVGGDWIFPYTNEQLKVFADGAWNIWQFREIPTGSQIAHQNLYLFQLFAGLFSYVGMSGILFQRIFVILILLAIYFSAFLWFKKITKNNFASVVGALVYLFSPLVFNYFNMGWWFVLLFLALMPTFLWLGIKYIKEGSLGALIGCGVITSISFLQSQSMVWMPMLAVVLVISLSFQIKVKKLIGRLFWLLFVMGAMTVLVHMAWLIPLSLHPENYVVSGTSNKDVLRFGVIANIFNQLRGWGSLFNEHFELSFKSFLEFSSYVYVGIAIYLLGFRNKIKYSSFLLLGIMLILLPSTLYFLRFQIAQLPFSNVVRDVSRFMVLSSLGFGLVTALFFLNIKNILFKVIVVILIIFSIHPFLLGRLTKPEKVTSGNGQFGKDQRIRFLELPQDEVQTFLVRKSGKRSLLFPTGGFVASTNDPRFNDTFLEIADQAVVFSPYATGIFASDKTGSVVNRFAKVYLDSAIDFPEKFKNLSKIYGVDTIFVRNSLVSTYNRESGDDLNFLGCEQTGLNSTDWSISKICKIDKPYPNLFVSTSPVVEGYDSFIQSVESLNDQKSRLVSLSCPIENEGDQYDSCFPSFVGFNGQKISVNFIDLGNTRYRIKVNHGGANYVLVLNQTYHPGWVIKNVSNNMELQSVHLVVNQLVNGWLITPFSNETSSEYIVEFAPQILYSKLIWVSIGFLVLGIFSSIFLLYRDWRKDKKY